MAGSKSHRKAARRIGPWTYLVLVAQIAFLFLPIIGANAASAPSIQEFIEGGSASTYTDFSTQVVALNPGGTTYVGELAAVEDDGPTPKVFATGSNGDLYEFTQSSGTWQPPFNITGSIAGAPLVTHGAKAIFDGTNVQVFALEQTTGDLIEFSDNGPAGSWTVLDLNNATGSAIKLAALAPTFVSGWASFVLGTTASGQLIEVVDDELFRRTWNLYDVAETRSAIAVTNAPTIVGGFGSAFHVYAQGTDDHLVEYTDDHLWGNTWNAYDQTVNAGGPRPATIVSGPPSAIDWNGPHVFADADTGVAEFIPDGDGGRLWNSYVHGEGSSPGNPSSVLGAYLPGNNVVPTVFAVVQSGDLEAFIADHANPPDAWSTYDVTSLSSGPTLESDPVAAGGGGLPVYVFGMTP